jgi:cbb3-type cytochrome oxidase subunit 3
MIEQIVQHLRENQLIWLMVMFVGVFYWGVRARRQARIDSETRSDD